MNMSVEAIKINNIFKQKNFTDEEAKEIVGYFDTTVKSGTATREDLLTASSELKQEIANIRLDVSMAISKIDKKFTILGILILVATIIMNPRVFDFVGKLSGFVK